MAKTTALFALHEQLSGKMVEYAGYLLPVQYKKGISFEHNAVRTAAGLFDVSHMGEILLTGKNAEKALRKLVTNNVSTMEIGQCRYALMCYRDGGIVDDIIIYKQSDNRFLLVVNAANREKDFLWIAESLEDGATAVDISDQISQLALQGPASLDILKKLHEEGNFSDFSKLPDKPYRFVEDIDIAGEKCIVSTTGYTGEAGYEIYLSNTAAPKLAELLLTTGESFGIEPAGLGARDTLRFEVCMPLYGHELSPELKAHEVGLNFFIKYDEDFIGKEALLSNPPKYKRYGLKIIDRGIAREHCDVYTVAGEKIGFTSSGAPCPSLANAAYAMALLELSADLKIGDAVKVDVRGRMLAAEIVPTPFYKKSN